MRRILSLFFGLITLHIVAMADNDKPVQLNQMPQPAQQFIKTHFAQCKIALSKKESDFFNKSYEVIFTNGNKIDFDGKGNWKEVNCKYTEVPEAIIPQKIWQFIKNKYPGHKVLSLERDKKEYELKLTDRLELVFDLQYNLKDIKN